MKDEPAINNPRPVVVRRNHERWAPAFLLGRTSTGGCWLLSFDPDRRVHRIRAGSEVVEVDPEKHKAILQAYQDVQRRIASVLQGRQGRRLPKGPAGRPRKVHDAAGTGSPAQESR